MAHHFLLLSTDRLNKVKELLDSAVYDRENGWDHYATALSILKSIYKNNAQDAGIKSLVSKLRAATWPVEIRDIPDRSINITPETFDALKTPHHYENFRKRFASINRPMDPLKL